jgi:hypothetical protein
VICEEAASIPRDTFSAIVVPMLLRRGSSLLAISTVLGNDNVYSQMMDCMNMSMKPPEPYFLTVAVNLKCSQAGCPCKGDLCWRTAHLIPAWHSVGLHDAARALLADSPAIRDRELMGQIADDGVPQYRSDLVDAAFLSSAPVQGGHRGLGLGELPVSFVVISVDPSNCGSSEYAVVSAAYTADKMVILGMDTTDVKDIGGLEAAFVAHVRCLAAVVRNAHIFLAVEANCGVDIAGLHEDWLRTAGFRDADFTSLRERTGSSGRTAATAARGIWTFPGFKVCHLFFCFVQ